MVCRFLCKTDCKNVNWAEQIAMERRLRELLVNNGLESRTSGDFHIEFAHILNGLEVKTVKLLGGDEFNQRCFCHGLSPSPCILMHTFRWFSLLYFEIIMFVCSNYVFFLMSTFHCWGNFILKTRFYSTLQFRETIPETWLQALFPFFFQVPPEFARNLETCWLHYTP